MAKRTKTRTDNVQAVTDRIVEALEAGVTPWICPWNKGAAMCVPHNGHTGRPYNGINIFLLWLSGHADSRWYTYKQVAEHYGESHVKKGSKGTHIVFWKFLVVDEKDANGQPVIDSKGNPVKKSIPLCKTYTVFNHTQVEWDADHEPGTDFEPVDPAEAFEAANDYFESIPMNLTHAGGMACYSSSSDTVTLPPVAVFNTVADYWATRAHETVHWTGHKTRCDRQLGNRFGSDAYAAEELIAEMGAAFLCAQLGIEGKLQHASYIDHWVKVMKADKFAVFTAARKAQEAVTFLDEAVEAGAAKAA